MTRPEATQVEWQTMETDLTGGEDTLLNIVKPEPVPVAVR